MAKDTTEQDIVMTPLYIAERIVNHFKPQGSILEPCKGSGNFLKYLPQDTQWCEITEGKDFMEYNGKVDWIITNPPWGRIRDFLYKSFDVADNIVLLMRVDQIWTKARVRVSKEKGFKVKEIVFLPVIPEFPQMGFQLGAVHWKRHYNGMIAQTDWT